MVQAKQIINDFEQIFPLELKMRNDPSGLQIGNITKQIKKILVVLDVRPETVQEAVDLNVDLIISHHPAWFKPLENFDTTIPQVEMYETIIKHDIVVYSAHTNVDRSPKGMNFWLSEQLQLDNIEPLMQTNEEKILDSEFNLNGVSLGVSGELPKIFTKSELIDFVKSSLGVRGLRIVDNENNQFKKIAIIGGDGGKYFSNALKSHADVFLTGDLYYHTAQDIEASGLFAIDPGHHIEQIFKKKISGFLEDLTKEKGYNIDIIASGISTEPFQFV